MVTEFDRVRTAFQLARRRQISPYYDLPTFCDHGPDHRTSKLHRYTACYLPELAARLIRKHSRPGDTVVDCFLGSGTTAIQAVAHGRRALGVDIHRVAIEIARARIAPVYPGQLKRAVQIIQRGMKRSPAPISLPDDPHGWDWRRWFPSDSHLPLSRLRRLIVETEDSNVRRLLLVGTAGALKPVSYWYSHATKLQFDPTKKPMDIREVMMPRLEQIMKINDDLWEHVEGRNAAQQRRVSARLDVGTCCDLPFDDETADLAVSSPPYFIAYDYAKLLRVSSWWIFGEVASGSGHLETAGRSVDLPSAPPPDLGIEFMRTFRASARKLENEGPGCSASHVRTLIRNLVPFFTGIKDAVSELYRVLRPRGKLCLVLGNTRHCGAHVRTAEITMELALLAGFEPVAVHVRRQYSATQPQVRDNLGQFTSDDEPNQHTYRDEYVIVMRKP
jgi:DNA modification methylase